jgi:serine/threonine protein kinase
MTSVGTPLYAAPEVLRGDFYDEKVDVYSFGLMLMTMAVHQPILDFLGERWCGAFHKTRPPRQMIHLVRAMTEDQWRPVTEKDPIPHAPTSINELIVICCAHEPRERPSFKELLRRLMGDCKIEIESGTIFRRKPQQEFAAHVVSHSDGLPFSDAGYQGGRFDEGGFDADIGGAGGGDAGLETATTATNPMTPTLNQRLNKESYHPGSVQAMDQSTSREQSSNTVASLAGSKLTLATAVAGLDESEEASRAKARLLLRNMEVRAKESKNDPRIHLVKSTSKVATREDEKSFQIAGKDNENNEV